MSTSDDLDPKFIAYGELADTVKWLRALGLDCVFDGSDALPDVILKAAQENRIFISLKTLPSTKRVSALILKSEEFGSQVNEILDNCPGPVKFKLFSRCMKCNEVLEDCQDELDEIPDSVRERNLKVLYCQRCCKHYWRGSHVERMLEKLAAIGLNIEKIIH